ncbi:hypothetical protein [Sphingobium sp. B10D7B]|uniref:hypothetical protein n=1 Tax=Sphingobium sp. B10D7B TaxID=2940573 RepID=UPI0022256875|nr:hypothetical protein [Sphingobium sp. B10D7B]
MRKLASRWSRQQESALLQMTRRKRVRQRIAGFAKSERVDAKFFLVALAPFVPIMISDELGWSRGIIWYAWFGLSVAWALVVVGINVTSYLRALRRSLHRNL